MTSRRLEAEWRAKLKASGFQDLESADRDAPLSNRGNLHAITEVAEDHERLAQRMETGSAYYEWAAGLLHSHRFRSPLDRRIWEFHAEGTGLRSTALALGITFHDARDVVNAIKLAGKQGNHGRQAIKWRQSHVQAARKYRVLTFPTVVKLAALLLRSVKTPMPS